MFHILATWDPMFCLWWFFTVGGWCQVLPNIIHPLKQLIEPTVKLREVLPNSEVWTCENGQRTVLHSAAYDVCQVPRATVPRSLGWYPLRGEDVLWINAGMRYNINHVRAN